MMRRFISKILCCSLLASAAVLPSACAGEPVFPDPVDKGSWTVSSPDQSVAAQIRLDADGELTYSVTKDETVVVGESGLGLTIAEDDFRLLTLDGVKTARITGSYDNYSGKSATVAYDCNEITITLKGWKFYLDVIMRAYDDGYALRYNVRAIDGSSGIMTVESENTEFAIPANSALWTQPYEPIFSYVTSFAYEEPYVRRSISGISSSEYLSFPVLYQVSGTEVYSLITESELIGSGFYGSYLSAAKGKEGEGVLQTVATPAGVQTDNDQIEYPFESPWRVGITGSLGDVVESNLVEKVYDDSESALWVPDDYEGTAEEYWSWVDPGVSTWSWLEMQKHTGDSYTTQAGTVSGVWHQSNLAIHKDYIDLAAEMGWKYVLMDGGWNQSDSAIKEIVQYAEERGIRLFVWCDALQSFANGNADVLKNQLDLWASYGIAGIKIDFFDGQTTTGNTHQGEDVDTIKWYETIYQECAKRHMLVNAHGANKPTGERRQYPNVINREAVYGGEKQNIPSSYTVTSMYTRNVVGPTDFTPMVYNMKMGGASMIHNIALAVLYESGAPNYGDAVTAYTSDADIKNLFMSLDALHDETVFLSGTPDSWYCAAIRIGEDWFVACINSLGDAEIDVSFDFLGDGEYSAAIYTEPKGNAEQVTVAKETITKASSKTLQVFENGGFVIHLTKNAE